MRSLPAVIVLVVAAACAAALSTTMTAVPEASHQGEAPVEADDQPASQPAIGAEVAAVGTFEFRPRVINLDSSGRYVTGLLVLPDGHTVRDVFIPSIQLNGVVYASTEFSPHNPVVEYKNKGSMMLKFEKEWVLEVLPDGQDVPVWVTGMFIDGTPFEAKGTVTVID